MDSSRKTFPLAVLAFVFSAAVGNVTAGDIMMEVRLAHGTRDKLAAAITELRLKHVRNYESIVVISVPPQALAAFRARAVTSGWRVVEHQDWQTLHLPQTTLTSQDVAARAGMLRRPPKGLYVVQFDSPLADEDHALLTAAGATYLSYVPYNGALVVAPASIMTINAQSPRVQVVTPFDATFRAHAARPDGEQRVAVQLPNLPDAEETLARLKATSSSRVAVQIAGLFQNVSATIKPSDFDDLLSDPYVVSISPEAQPIFSGEREAIALTNLGSSQYSGETYQNGTQPFKPLYDYRNWLQNRSLIDAQGFRAAIVDTGLDRQFAPAPGSGFRPFHPDIDRTDVVFNTYLGGGDASDECGHGTLVAGLLAGNPTLAADDGGFLGGMGVAPGAPLYIQRIANVNCQPMAGINHLTMANDAYMWGAAVQTHSYNDVNSPGTYTLWAQTVDLAIRDTWGNDGNDTPMPMTMSAGNIQPGLGGTMVASPATAKNAITVGATESYRPGATQSCDQPDVTNLRNVPQDFLAASYRNVAFLSRRGTADGRIKPEIVAPGTLVNSTRTQYQDVNSNGQRGAGFCQLSASGYYTIDSGTSFAAPQVAGACLLLDRRVHQRLSPAMLKAALVGNALSVSTGTDDRTGLLVGARPNTTQGFGRLYLGDAFSGLVTQTFLDETAWTPFTGAGQYRSRAFTIADPTRNTIVVLAWTDEPGNVSTTSAPTLVRDLDAEVALDACTSYTGNRLTASEVSRRQTDTACSGLGITYDNLNNVEMIVVPANTLTTFNLDIYSSSWGFGGHNQKFAVFASNAY